MVSNKEKFAGIYRLTKLYVFHHSTHDQSENPMTDVEVAKKKGEDQLKIMINRMQHSFSYAETAYHLPISFALTGIAVHDQKAALDVFLRTGSNTLVASECILAEKTAAEGKEPSPYTGFIDDTIIRKLGYSLVDGSILGLALVVGTPQSADSAAAICRELQEKYMLTFLAGDVISSLSRAGVSLDWNTVSSPLAQHPPMGFILSTSLPGLR